MKDLFIYGGNSDGLGNCVLCLTHGSDHIANITKFGKEISLTNIEETKQYKSFSDLCKYLLFTYKVKTISLSDNAHYIIKNLFT